jgi:hypothetical protein
MNAQTDQTPGEVVFVMGLPRSGSTLLSRLLNDSRDIISVNDLYFLQAVLAENAEKATLTDEQTRTLTDQLLQVIDTRANAKEEFIGQFQVSPERIEEIRRTVIERQSRTPYVWHRLMDELLGAVAASAGKTRWADKTPQNFYHFQMLADCFPEARFVFLFRDPRPILASYKYASGEGHDARRYHPMVYSLYWRSAIRFYEIVKRHPRVTMVRYEDLLSNPAQACADLGKFLGTSIDAPQLASLGHNSSFAKGDRKTITPTEKWLCERLCSDEMTQLGYAASDVSPRLRDLPALLGVSVKFSLFQISRLVGNRDARTRIATFIRGLAR